MLGKPLVVGLGEALFDCFPDRQLLGGAPVNLVVHLNALLQPQDGTALPATRVGDDTLGKRFVKELGERGVDTTPVQVDRERPTGTVEVRPRTADEAEYHFKPDVAWDHLELTESKRRLAFSCDAICFGTLAQRSPESAATIHAMLLAAVNAVRLLDVNLRQDFYNAEMLDQSFRLATAVKLNVDELATVAPLLGVTSDVKAFMKEYELDWVAVTNGAAGTTLFNKETAFTAVTPSYAVAAGADSVGAGDACAAGLLFGVLNGWDFGDTVQLANTLGAYVASQPGATPVLPPAVLALSQSLGGS